MRTRIDRGVRWRYVIAFIAMAWAILAVGAAGAQAAGEETRAKRRVHGSLAPPGNCYSGPLVVPGDKATRFWWRIVVPDAGEREAVCNNGCPYTYFVRPGRNGNENKWLIFLKGGKLCDTIDECNSRWVNQPALMRPTPSDWYPDEAGIRDPRTARNPDWGDWTHVYMPYCSSDLWVGDRGGSYGAAIPLVLDVASSPSATVGHTHCAMPVGRSTLVLDSDTWTGPSTLGTGGWHFRGHRILKATLEDLVTAPEGLPKLKDATEVMLFGGSAGGAGVIFNLDKLAASVNWARVVGVEDSGFPPPLRPKSERTRTSEARQLALWHPKLDASCVEAEADSLDCLEHLELLDRHVTTPLFVYTDQFDTYYLDSKRIHGLCVEPECQIHADCSDPYDTCANGICVDTTPAEPVPSFCPAPGECVGSECSSDAECAGELACNQGFCSPPLPVCQSNAECLEGEFCQSGRCARPAACDAGEACHAGETCIGDLGVCVRDLGCSTNADCDGDRVCIGRRNTPYALDFAYRVREMLEPLDGAFSTRAGIHVLIVKDNFYDLEVGGRYDYATVLGNWFFGRLGPKNVVAQP